MLSHHPVILWRNLSFYHHNKVPDGKKQCKQKDLYQESSYKNVDGEWLCSCRTLIVSLAWWTFCHKWYSLIGLLNLSHFLSHYSLLIVPIHTKWRYERLIKLLVMDRGQHSQQRVSEMRLLWTCWRLFLPSWRSSSWIALFEFVPRGWWGKAAHCTSFLTHFSAPPLSPHLCALVSRDSGNWTSI